MLVIRAAEALAQCRSVAAAEQFAGAVVSWVELLVREELADRPPLPEQLVVVLDASGASSMQVRALCVRVWGGGGACIRLWLSLF